MWPYLRGCTCSGWSNTQFPIGIWSNTSDNDVNCYGNDNEDEGNISTCMFSPSNPTLSARDRERWATCEQPRSRETFLLGRKFAPEWAGSSTATTSALTEWIVDDMQAADALRFTFQWRPVEYLFVCLRACVRARMTRDELTLKSIIEANLWLVNSEWDLNQSARTADEPIPKRWWLGASVVIQRTKWMIWHSIH